MASAQPLYQSMPGAHLRGHRLHVVARGRRVIRQARERWLLSESRLVLGEHLHLVDAGVDEVREAEVDDPVAAAERDRRLGALAGERLEPGPGATGENHRERLGHGQRAFRRHGRPCRGGTRRPGRIRGSSCDRLALESGDRHGPHIRSGSGGAEPPLAHQAWPVRRRAARAGRRGLPRAPRRGDGAAARPTGLLVLRPRREYAVLDAVARRMVAPASGLPLRGCRCGWPGPPTACRARRSRARRRRCKQLLGLFENALAGFLFGGRTRPFTRLDRRRAGRRCSREWQDSRLAVRRTGYAALRTLVLAGYYGRPRSGRRWATPGRRTASRAQRSGVAGRRRSAARRQRASGTGSRTCREQRGADLHRRRARRGHRRSTATCCVVGSGAGGAVLAARAHRARAGRGAARGGRLPHPPRVRPAPRPRLPDAVPGARQPGDGRPVDHHPPGAQRRRRHHGELVHLASARRERILELWRDQHGVEGPDARRRSLPHWEAIEKRLHIAEWPLERMNRNNRVLWDGCGKLGYERGLIRRNVNDCANLGYCGLGCPIDAKQSMLVTLHPRRGGEGADRATPTPRCAGCESDGRRVAAVQARGARPGDRPAHRA